MLLYSFGPEVDLPSARCVVVCRQLGPYDRAGYVEKSERAVANTPVWPVRLARLHKGSIAPFGCLFLTINDKNPFSIQDIHSLFAIMAMREHNVAWLDLSQSHPEGLCPCAVLADNTFGHKDFALLPQNTSRIVVLATFD